MPAILRAEEHHLPAIGELWKEFMDAIVGYGLAKIERRGRPDGGEIR